MSLLIVDSSTFNSNAISIFVIDPTNRAELFLVCLRSEIMRYQDWFMQYSISEGYVYAFWLLGYLDIEYFGPSENNKI